MAVASNLIAEVTEGSAGVAGDEVSAVPEVVHPEVCTAWPVRLRTSRDPRLGFPSVHSVLVLEIRNGCEKRERHPRGHGLLQAVLR